MNFYTLRIILLAVLLCSPFFINLYKLSGCNFEAPYRCEIIHTIGFVMPPLSWATVWFDSDHDET